MWIFTTDGFFSIVEDYVDPRRLLVRARAKGDIEKVWPLAAVEEIPGRDYRYRAYLPRTAVAAKLADLALRIDYGNFKNTINNPLRKEAYGDVWSVMIDFQNDQLKQRQLAEAGK